MWESRLVTNIVKKRAGMLLLVKLVRTYERDRETLREEQIHPGDSKITRRRTLVSYSFPLPVILRPLPSGCAVPFKAQPPATSPSPSPCPHPELRPTHHLKQVQIRHSSRSHAPADQAGAQRGAQVHDVWLLFHSRGHHSASSPPMVQQQQQ
ncbi:uncharacterized protein LOC119293715 isoform X4 [Triticum dicoccoides]|nr:uncharacterized protein LOC119293715 isoform X4 [Triticum dicoccoides]XP_037427990.1 uncharacterized protein LOC119293715 isoform X4 [Triticum dicoccoides]